MKKLNLLLILPLTAVMALDFTMTEEGLFTDTTTPPPPITTPPPVSEVSNSYLEPINIPTYDSSNPSHILITASNGKWTSTNLNSTTYKHFYVEPGDYSSNIITLTADGTSGDRRSISLYNGNDTHPASLSISKQADIKIKFDNADYWDIDRMSGLNYQAHKDEQWFYNGASYNTINRHYLKDFYNGIRIQHQSNYNTIQNSYLDTMTKDGRLSDNVGIAITTGDQGANTTIYGTKIIKNDIKNCGDSIQLITGTGGTDNVNYAGTIIDSNRLWVDNTIYYNKRLSDGGVLDPNGMYSLSENAIDFKSGSSDSANPVLVTNNIMFGFRQNTEDGNRGKAFSLMYSPKNVTIENNIIADTDRGMAINKPGVTSYSAENLKMNNNIFYKVNMSNGDVIGLDIKDGLDIEVKNNSLIDSAGWRGVWFEDNSGTTTWKNNLIITAGDIVNISGSLDSSNNYVYNSNNKIDGTGDIIGSNANMDDYSFQYERFTTSPKSKTLTGVINTSSSPHYGVAGSSIK